MAHKSDIQQDLPQGGSVLDRFRRWGEGIFNNIDQINYFGRLKDVSKLFEAAASGAILTRRAATTADEKATRLHVGRIADTVNGIFQIGLSYLSNWDDKSRTVRTYAKLVKEELHLDHPVTFGDLKRSQNPIIRDTVKYYARKSLYRLIPDFLNFLRFVPLAAKPLGENAYNAIQPIEEVSGITASLGAKALYFGWYFTERIEGSHYALKDLWNKTEGVTNLTNRTINQNVEPGNFVRWGEISKLYSYVRAEHPKMKLAPFTPDDPLTSRVFEQVARYLNHSYSPKLFAVQESKEKQQELQDKYFSHAMLVDLIGSGGLRVEDAIGSAIRLEIMAHYGAKDDIGTSMKKLREADKMLQQIHRPKLSNYASVEHGAEALQSYFIQMSNIAEHFLGDAWPTRYFEKEIKSGYIDYYFDGNAPEVIKQKLLDETPILPAPEPDKNWANNRISETPRTDKFKETASHTEHAMQTGGIQTLAV